MSAPLVSLLVLNWNGKDVIGPCLESLCELRYANTEVVVIDNASTDGSADVAAKFKSVRLVRLHKNHGYAQGNNIGFGYCRGEYVATLNNDIVADPDWLREPIEAFLAHPRTGVIASRQMKQIDPQIIDGLYHYVTECLILHGYGGDLPFDAEDPMHGAPGWVVGANGASALYRRGVLEQLGGFDPDFYAYHEDCDLSLRAFWAGWDCYYAPTAVVHHMRSHSFGHGSPLYAYQFERNRYWFILKNYPMSWVAARLPRLAFAEFDHAMKALGRRGHRLAYLRARWDSLVGVPATLAKGRMQDRAPVRKERLRLLMAERKIPVSAGRG